MSKREYLTRYLLIIRRLRKSPAAFREISDYLQRESELQEYNFSISKRTMQRDIGDILSIFGIQIEFDFSRKVYFIADDGQTDFNNRMFEAYELFDALRLSDKISSSVYFDNRRAHGVEHLHGILYAVKNRRVIRFNYQKFWEEEIYKRTGEPYALKEFKNRWYVLMHDTKDKTVKSFGLDRISDLEITNSTFKQPEFDVRQQFQNCFGIISPHNDEPQNIILSFNPVQGRYVKSQPLHESQEILFDTKDETRVHIKTYITDDLIMEFLSHGDNVEVMKPLKFRDEIAKVLKRSLAKYK